jgi:hypothetical protein
MICRAVHAAQAADPNLPYIKNLAEYLTPGASVCLMGAWR